jgi:hypothetical protein
MENRTGSQVFYRHSFESKITDEYMKRNRETMPDISLMSIIIAALVRTIALRPALNRFVINGQIFARYDIEVSFVVKKSLKDDSPETTIKLKFDGTETIGEITEAIGNAIHENLKDSGGNDTDKLAERFMKLPNGIIKMVVGFIKWLDKHGMLPKDIIEASPFHVSVFLTNMRSIKLDYLYHHLYDFGTASLFVSMGRTHKNTQDESKNHFYVAYTIDERICDGFYLSNTMRLFESFLSEPALMEQKLEAKTEDIK